MDCQRGFTLLELLIALVILSASLAVLLQIQTNQIKRIGNALDRIEALQYYERLNAGIPVDKRFTIKIEKKYLPYGFKEVSNKIYKSEGEIPVLVIKTYEK